MNTKKERLEAISRIIGQEVICNQEELLRRLEEEGFPTTQGTLSRDIKELKLVRGHDGNSNYVYSLPASFSTDETPKACPGIEFSGNLGVMKTRPGYAMGIASDIDKSQLDEILATVAGDDTILLIPREGYSRENIAHALAHFMQ